MSRKKNQVYIPDPMLLQTSSETLWSDDEWINLQSATGPTTTLDPGFTPSYYTTPRQVAPDPAFLTGGSISSEYPNPGGTTGVDPRDLVRSNYTSTGPYQNPNFPVGGQRVEN